MVKIESISPKVRKKTKVHTLTTTFQHSFGSFSHGNQRRKRNKGNTDWNRRSKTLTVCRWYDPLLRMLSFKPGFSLSFFTFIKRLFSSSSLSALRVVSSAYLRLLLFLPVILTPACASSRLAFRMMYEIYLYAFLHISKISRVTIYSLDILHSQFWTSLLFYVQFCYLLTHIQVSQEIGKVVLYSISLRIFHSSLWFTLSKALV